MLDEDRELFAINNKLLKLTKSETIILSVLIQNKNRYTSIQTLYDRSECNSINSIRKILSMLGNKLKARYIIKCKKNVGYKIIAKPVYY